MTIVGGMLGGMTGSLGALLMYALFGLVGEVVWVVGLCVVAVYMLRSMR